jgi:asparagine synthase (glutamine-hydrolysing)
VCGIYGVLQPRGDTVPGLQKMRRHLAHRGPDGEGLERLGNAILGHQRLSIIDLTETGAQPMWDVRRQVCITFNGEIYNYRELRDECRKAGMEFRSASDTEAILNLYLLHGERAFARLNGIFAFGLIDTRTGDAFLVRDPAGIKPLYYGRSANGIAFASELGALIASRWFPLDVDPSALQAYMQLDFVPSPMSIVRGIQKLPGAMLLHVPRDGTESVRRFSDVPDEEIPASPNPEADVDRFSALMRQVVERQMIADVPVGIFLSGGIDSSIVAHSATQVAGRVSTFSIAFDEPSFDERPYFETVARAIGSEHHTETLGPSTMVDLFPRVASVVSEPLADGSIFPTYFLSRYTRKRVKVALSGDGADELFGGYPTHRLSNIGRTAALLPKSVRSAIANGAHRLLPVSHANLSLDYRIRKFLEGLDRDPLVQNERWLASFQPEEIAEVATFFDPEAQRALVAAFHAAVENVSPGRPLERILRLDRRFYLQDGVLVKTDRASMASSLEVRVPFLDNAMIAFANGLTADRKVRGRTSKWLLREYARRYFPESIWRRPKKGFGAPLARWFRADLRPLVRDTLSPSRLEGDGFFRTDAVMTLLEEHESGQRDHRKKIFNVLMFTMWYEWAKGL